MTAETQVPDLSKPLEHLHERVEGAGPEGVLVETCKRGHLFAVDQDDEAAEAAEREEGDRG